MKKRHYDLSRPSPDQNVRVDMQFTGDLAARIAAIAEKTGVSAAAVVRMLVHEALEVRDVNLARRAS